MGQSIDRQTREFDAILAADLQKHCVSQDLPLSAIPIIGYPGWWPVQDETFYHQVKYFRGPYPQSGV